MKFILILIFFFTYIAAQCKIYSDDDLTLMANRAKVSISLIFLMTQAEKRYIRHIQKLEAWEQNSLCMVILDGRSWDFY